MIEFFLGTRPIEQLVRGEGAEARIWLSPHLLLLREIKARCQSLFYLGEWNLIHKNTSQARAELGDALNWHCYRRP